ncbi:hypothetical protein F2Q68_00043423 [Brassica cretica]|uniref:Uncharacterized protein n=1 Tax=Brassica cretica TaxID=69181 RepID=A0A8S9LIB1_BRACR|nr:hypothetical protein F2Q68_00043423 [Brassica cretica]
MVVNSQAFLLALIALLGTQLSSLMAAGFSDLDLDMQVFQIWKISWLEVFQATSRKSSRRIPGSLLTESSPMSPFHNRSERFGFSDLGLIYMFFRSGSDFGRPMGSLLGSLLKYNALEEFQEVFETASKKSSRKSSDRVFFHI